ncbi:YkgJ family cysteine cluster protein [Enterocloster bolteae]|uniref:YkgJ family cysteine cluster protein n=1 Tax=Enterocloster bolteae TaxID=208479 RepID=UPI0028DC7B49|nr:YkgJ family cysteine cluster protein [Enterocloster bolteae]
MKEFLMKMVPVKPKEHFPFQCRQCGECCRHVKESVPLESLDAFRLAKYLRDRREPIQCMDDVLAKYAEPVLLHESGYIVFMLKTVGPDDACIFLKDNKCTIHAAKPRACRTYPISVGPANSGDYEAYLSMEQTHHFKGPQQSVKKWIQKRCSQQDYDFWETDIGSVQEIARLLGKLPLEQKKGAFLQFLRYKYSDFDLDKSFTEQFKSNNQKLLEALRSLVQKRDENSTLEN